ncbi:type I polyketide synthase [Thiorhodovibrio frisius]|uniref:type I polyketide synthase n=1 Tax=Thiorhodovibrio frisius TaxID=631362 RepID=UPI00068535BE|nr:type I polyketide synthase [Thiorhodovibrio frisius]
MSALLEPLTEREHWLILCEWSQKDLHHLLDALPARQLRHLLLEITDASQLCALEQFSELFEGLVAKGHESGGLVGDDSVFVLSQKILAHSSLPLYAQGAIGLHSAAACWAAGCAGVVLDDSLWQMPESALPDNWQTMVSKSDGQDTRCIGALRILKRRNVIGLERLESLNWQRPDDEVDDVRIAANQDIVHSLVGWGDPREWLWPMGQGLAESARIRARYKTTGRYVRALLEQSALDVNRSQTQPRLVADGPLAVSHATRYPIVQGPMTRVSDVPGFAASVAEAGALPMLALALLRADSVEKLLADTQALLGERPWGVGLLGFAPAELRVAQLEIVRRIRPGFALIAGGRPDQAMDLEKAGIATYLHAPTPALARLYVEQGARRLVFEGRECGGHVGPLGSFALWDGVVSTLLECVSDALAPEMHLLFAGGIHDRRSAAMVEALAAPLSARGMKIGVLIGTAYLFTREAVAHGAILPGFQQQALECVRTVNLETGPGHASRCAVTPFADTFEQTRQSLREQGLPADEISQELDRLCLGRLRVAAKGILRDGQRLTDVDSATQARDGMYMIGQVATLRDQVIGIAELHRDLCTPGPATLPATAEIQVDKEPSPSDIAIVGIGSILPGADSTQGFWSNILEKIDNIGEIPPSRWDWRLYFDADPSTRDKVYSKWGAFLDEVPFDPARFGIPPKSLPSIDPIQLLSLEAVRRALADGGYADGDFDRANTSVILGFSGGLGELGEHYATRAELTGRLQGLPDAVLDALPEWTADSFPGLLPNVAAGRVANRFDLGGANFTVDAACASSLTAIDVAVSQLDSGRCNLAIAGGVDTKLSPFAYLCFSKTPALTPQDRARPFDADTDGILLGEGVAMVVLKRLADAEADGDRIYAVIKASASSSDGKALGLTAPRASGQRLAFDRAYRKAGINPATLGLYEAHGTGTRLGDETELGSITKLLSEHQARVHGCALGSVKALIGHTKSTAGVAALIKASLALYHRAIPPQPGVRQPMASLREPTSPVYLAREPIPWLRNGSEPCRAGVSAFGFGGTNCHAVLEEYQGALQPPRLGGERWPCELILFAEGSRDALLKRIETLQSRLQDQSFDLLALAIEHADRVARDQMPWRLAVVANDQSSLSNALSQATAALNQPGKPLSPHIRLTGPDGPIIAREPHQIAFLFPGQGAQYPGMGREAALWFEPFRSACELAEGLFANELPQRLSHYLWPRGQYDDDQQALAALTATEIAQPALGAVELGYLDLLAALGLVPDMVGGHSYGEFIALAAAGALMPADILRLSRARGLAMAGAKGDGAMAAVQASRDSLEPLLAGSALVLANHNAPEQSVLSGPQAELETLLEQLAQKGMKTRRLPVAGAFHSPLIADSQGPLTAALDQVSLVAPRIPVYSNIDARPYPSEPDAVRAQLKQHLLSPVGFVDQIQAMYAAGARIFIEAGPRAILTGLTSQILAGTPHLAVAMDGTGGGLRGIMCTLGALFVEDVNINTEALFAGRRPVAQETIRAGWMVSGGGVRRRDEPVRIPIPVDLAALAGTKIDSSGPPITNEYQHDMNASTASPDGETGGRASATDRPGAHQADASSVLAAYQSYQATMQQFLTLQERVMNQFLTGTATELPMPVVPDLDGPGEVLHFDERSDVAASGNARGKSLSSAAMAPSMQSMDRRFADTSQAPAPGAGSAPTPVPDDGTGSEAVLDRAGLLARVTDVVSNCTGYPPDMLGPDQSLEAELGIDSIKRVEIISSVEKAMPQALAAAMRASMDQIARAANLNQLVDTLWGLLTSSSLSSHCDETESDPAAHQTPGNRQETALEHDRLLTIMVSVVSDCTGYPPEMLGPDQALEAEFGIDSIKRVEIIAGIEKALPTDLATAMRAQMDQISRCATLNALADALLTLQAETTLPENTSKPAEQEFLQQRPSGQRESESARVPVETRSQTLGRYSMRAIPAPRPEPSPGSILGQVLITEDGLGVASLLAEQLSARNIPASILKFEDVASEQALRETLDQARANAGPFGALVHLAGLERMGLPETLANWQRESRRHIKQLFALLSSSAAELRAQQAPVLSASLLGGAFGRDGHCGPGLPLAAAAVGLLKTARIEWPELRTRAIDFPDDKPERLVEWLLDELLASDDADEIGYAKGTRALFEARLDPLHTSIDPQPHRLAGLEPSSQWVVLALGGARGITAEVLRELLRPGMSLVLVGRSRLEPESLATRGVEDDNVLRAALIEQVRATATSPTPVEIDRRLKQLKRSREIARNIADFEEAGARVEYQPIDARDPTALVTLIEKTYQRHGRIDALLQGVGIIEDKLLQDKQPESFSRVFDTKVDSTYLLCRHLRPESLKLALLFASVAGRTGNRGQADYASANEAVNRLAWWMREQWPKTRVLAINWGPWAMTGMASEAVNRQFRERGVTPIPPASGRRFVRDELAFGDPAQVELIAGIFEGQGAPDTAVPAQAGGPVQPLLGLQRPEHQADGSMRLAYRFDLARDRYLDDHRLDGVPVVPAAVAMELMAECVAAGWPKHLVTGIRDLRVLNGIRLENDQPRVLEVWTQAQESPAEGMHEVDAELRDTGNDRLHYRATVMLNAPDERNANVPTSTLKDCHHLTASAAYAEHCFHGPLFQCLHGDLHIAPDGVDGSLRPSNPSAWIADADPQARWLFDPGIVDALLQTVILWARLHHQRYPLPTGFRLVSRAAGDILDAEQPLRLTNRIIQAGPSGSEQNFEVRDSQGRLILALDGVGASYSEALNRLAPSLHSPAAPEDNA